MTTELAVVQDDAPRHIRPERVELWKRTYCKGATDDEMEQFLSTCMRTGLDPESRQIYMASRRERDGERWTTTRRAEVTIDGLRLIAERSRKYAGQLGPWWCGPDGEWRDVWLADEPPVAARVAILRTDFREPMFAVARYESYAQRRNDGQPNAIWSKMPDLMLSKCAEALAIRKAFPFESSGLYTADEMAQADSPPPAIRTVQAEVVAESAQTKAETAMLALIEEAKAAGVDLKTFAADLDALSERAMSDEDMRKLYRRLRDAIKAKAETEE